MNIVFLFNEKRSEFECSKQFLTSLSSEGVTQPRVTWRDYSKVWAYVGMDIDG